MREAAALWLAASGILLALWSPDCAAADLKAGRQKALQCQACHGLDGVAKIPNAPNLAGQNEQYLLKALDDFKSGTRKNEMMSLVVPGLSVDDIANLAAYYAAIEVTVGKPPE
jgi:cytochrome c553